MTQTIAELVLNAIIERSNDHIMVTNEQGRILTANPDDAPRYGLDDQTMMSSTVFELERQGYYNPSATARTITSKQPTQLLQQTVNGRSLLSESFPVFDQNGELIRVISFSRDLTDLQILHREYEYLLQTLGDDHSTSDSLEVVEGLHFKSPMLKKLFSLIRRIAPTCANLLLLGESGVGKTSIAKLVHSSSARSEGLFMEVNCSAIPESLFESEMFGYVSGAFTGAAKGGKPGLIEQAEGGTLFLDEVAELSPTMQSKLLLALQSGNVTRLGATKGKQVDFRLITATNKDLEQEVQNGNFRLDLYYRLNVVPMMIPPLRERPEDIAVLIDAIIGRLNQRYENEKFCSLPMRQYLIQQPWPGNVRELENTLERLYVAKEGNIIDRDENDQLPVVSGPVTDLESSAADLSVGPCAEKLNLTGAVDAFEKQLLEKVLASCRTTRELAIALGVSQPTAHRRLKKHGLAFQDK